MMINLENIPKDLKTIPQWVCWRKIKRDGKDTKIPIDPKTCGIAKSNERKTWGTFDQARHCLENSDAVMEGVGFVLSDDDPFTGIDLDKCHDPKTSKIEPGAMDVIRRLNSYTEVSPSGTGIRIFIKGKLLGGGKKKGKLPDFMGGTEGALELYDRLRYLTLTGNHLQGTLFTIEERQGNLDLLYKEYFPTEKPETNNCKANSYLNNSEIIEKAKSSGNGNLFKRLFNGDISEYPSHSEADLALCSILAFWSGNNPEQIDQIFRISGLFRSKWDIKHYGNGRTYGQSVIEKAISGSHETYKPNHEPRRKSKNSSDNHDSAMEILRNIRQSTNISEAVIKAMESSETIDAFARVSIQDPGSFEATLADIQYKGLPRKFFDVLKKLINMRLKPNELKPQRRETENDTQYKKAGEMLPDCDCPYPNLLVPTNYFLTSNGTFAYQPNETVAHCPLLITGRFRNEEEGVEFFRLAWRRNKRWIHLIVDRGIALDGKRLITLASNGFPVAGDNAAKIIAYLHRLEAINLPYLPYARISNHMGWQGINGKEGFLWGRKLISPNGELTSELNIDNLTTEDWGENRIAFKGIASGDEQIADGYASSGTFEDWKKIIEPLKDYPKVLIGLYASFVPTLLLILKAPNSIIDFANRTSTGKTTVLWISASVWGLPDEKGEGAMGSWDATQVWLERASAILNGIPLILDDTKRAKKSKTVAEMIYMVAQGRGRGRGNTQSLARTRTWRTVLISSGEAPATSFSQDGGTRTRCIEVRGVPFEKDDDETQRFVNRINNQLLLNYGHAGPTFVGWLLKNQDRWGDFKAEYHELVEKYAAVAGTTEGGRLAQCMATLHLTEVLTFSAGITPWSYEERIKDVWHTIAAEAVDAAGEFRALQDIFSWAVANEHRFFGRHLRDNNENPKLPSGGWAGKWDKGENYEEIGFLPTLIKKVLEDLGYQPEAILAGWKGRNWLKIDGEKGYTVQRRIDGTKTRLIVIKKEALDQNDL